MCRSIGSAFAFLIVVAMATTARAHGRLPGPTALHFQPGNANVILLQTSRGLLGSRDGGGTWSWICYEVIDAETFGLTDPDMALMGNGDVLVAGGNDGVRTLAASWCDSAAAAPDPAMGYYIIDVERAPDDADTAFALASSGGMVANKLYKSTNDGMTWTATGNPVASVLLETVEVAPSNPNVIYVTATTGGKGVLYRSDDGGATWTPTPVFSTDLAAGEYRLEVLGVDPTDAMRVYLRVAHDTSSDTPAPDRLLLSTAGGAGATPIAEGTTIENVGGFAISDDGSTVWIGDNTQNQGGLWKSVNDAAFTKVADVYVRCLDWHDGKLWVCGDNFADGFALATSADGSAPFQPVLKFSDVTQVLSCPAGTAGACACGAVECEALQELEVDLASAAPQCTVGDAGVPSGVDGGADSCSAADAGTGGGGPGSTSGGGCSVGAVPGDGPGAGLAGMMVLILALGVRRRRRA